MRRHAIEIGDPPADTVLKLCLSLEGLEWLVEEMERHNREDLAVRELRQALTSLQVEAEQADPIANHRSAGRDDW